MKKILVPCDFSTCCENAVKFAVELAGLCNGEVVILTILRLPEQLSDIKDLDLCRKQTRAGFEKIKNTYRDTVKIRHEIASGKMLAVILECITRKQIDLVIIGTKGSRGWQDIFMGSNAEKVVRASPVPVFSIKSPITVTSIKNIVLPCDLRHYQSTFIDWVKYLQKIFQAKLHLLRINTDVRIEDNTFKPQLQEYATHYGLDNVTFNVRFEYDEREGIIHFAKEINADMIVMATHGNLDMGHLFTTSIAADVVNHTNLPTWTFANTKRIDALQAFPNSETRLN